MTINMEDSKEFRINLGKNIKEARLKIGLTQSQLGELLGKSDNVITNWEKGTNRPDADMLGQLCNILKVSPNWLLNWNSLQESESHLDLIAAHLKSKNISDEKLKRIKKFIEFTLSEDE